MKAILWACCILALVSGCNYRIEKSQPNDESLFKVGTVMSYATVRDRVFIPKCVSCHGTAGGVNLETYEGARSRARDIKRVALVEKKMPPGRP
jgi:uncharacterized membrane protein